MKKAKNIRNVKADHPAKRPTPMLTGVRQRLLSGLLLLVPAVVTCTVLVWLFAWIRRLVRPLLTALFKAIEGWSLLDQFPTEAVRIMVFGMTLLLLLLTIYLVGTVGTKVFGRRIILRVESLFKHIPVAGTLYSASKQVVETFAGGSGRPVYKSVVLVDYPYPGSKALGFLTGQVDSESGQTFAKVFVPTAPSPVTGFLVIQPLDSIIMTDISVEEAFKMVLSGGLISPTGLSAALNSVTVAAQESRTHAD